MRVCATTDAAGVGWRAVTPLLPHQITGVEKLLPSRVGALFMEMGTGKSRTAIELARIRQSKISRVVWFCPVTLKETIRREILKHTDCGPESIYVFDGGTRESRLPMDRAWYVIGVESMSASVRAVFCAQSLIDDRAFVIVDESTYIKGHASKRTKRITLLSERARYRMVLTGTPITQGVVDLFAQMRFLSPKILGYNSFYTFARNHLVYSTRNKGQIVRSKSVDWLTERMKPYVYQVTKAQCLTLPEKLHENFHCYTTLEQDKAYERAKEEFCEDLLKYEASDSDLSNGIAVFRLFSRLQAIACGSFDGQRIAHNRLRLLSSVLNDVSDSHIAIWAKYRVCLDEIKAFAKEEGRALARIDGDVPERERDARIQRWKDSGGILLLTQSIGGHGLDLTAASTAVFYSSAFKYSEHVQAEDRFHRIGQTRPVSYLSLWADCGIEDRIRTALNEKANALACLRRAFHDIGKEKSKKSVRDLVMSL